MNRDSMNALRLDRRLLRRRGWLTAEELEEQLAALPDAAEKAQAVDVNTEAAAPEAPASGDPESSRGF